MQDPYHNFADRYDWMVLESPSRTAFFKNRFRTHRTARLLDCACGTGRDLKMFADFGLNVEGSDLSPAMLERARKTLSDAGLTVPLHQIDFRRLHDHFPDRFDAVVCLTSALIEVIDDTDALEALQSMRRVLKPGGILIFDQGLSDAMIQEKPKVDPILNTRDQSRLFVMNYEPAVMTIRICDFIHTDADCNLHTFTVRLRIRLLDDWKRLLDPAKDNRAEFNIHIRNLLPRNRRRHRLYRPSLRVSPSACRGRGRVPNHRDIAGSSFLKTTDVNDIGTRSRQDLIRSVLEFT